MAKINEKGQEILDPTPVAIPIGFHHPRSLHDRIADAVRGEMSRMASEKGQESFEEADDFEVGDDFDPRSPYEQNFDHDSNIKALDAAIKEAKKPKAKPSMPEQKPPERAPEPYDEETKRMIRDAYARIEGKKYT